MDRTSLLNCFGFSNSTFFSLWSVLVFVVLAFLFNGCRVFESPSEIVHPNVQFVVDGKKVPLPSDTILPGQKLHIETEINEDIKTTPKYFWKVIAGEAELVEVGSSAEFLSDRPGVFIVSLYVMVLSNGIKITSEPIFYRISVEYPGNADRPVPVVESDYRVKKGNSLQLDASESYDPRNAGAELSYFWHKLVPEAGVGPELENISKPVFHSLTPGKYIYMLYVSVGQDSSRPALVTVHVESGQSPIAKIVSSGGKLLLGDSLLLDGSESLDPDSQKILKYEWSLALNSADTTLKLDSSDTAWFKPEKTGMYTVLLRVQDAENNWSPTERISIWVQEKSGLVTIVDTLHIHNGNILNLVPGQADTIYYGLGLDTLFITSRIETVLIKDTIVITQTETITLRDTTYLGPDTIYQILDTSTVRIVDHRPGKPDTLVIEGKTDTISLPHVVFVNRGTQIDTLILGEEQTYYPIELFPETMMDTVIQTIIVTQSDTVYDTVVVRDTIEIVDTTFVVRIDTLYDTLLTIERDTIMDTLVVYLPGETIMDTLWLMSDTIFVMDTLIQIPAPDTIVITQPPDTIYVEASIQNQMPIANAGSDTTVPMGTELTLDASLSNDPDGDSIILYKWVAAQSNPSSIFPEDVSQPTLLMEEPGVYSFLLYVADSFSVSIPDEVTIIVPFTNSAPVIVLEYPDTMNVGQARTFDASQSSDPDIYGAPLTFQWISGAANPEVISLPSQSQPSFSPTVPGQFDFVLLVSDSLGIASTQTLSVLVRDTVMTPIANAGPDLVISLGDSALLNGSASISPHGKPLYYAWETLNGGELDSPANDTTWFRTQSPGDYLVGLTVSDGAFISPLDWVQISVKDTSQGVVNSVPIADAGPDNQYLLTNTITLDGSASRDPDGDSLRYIWSSALSNPNPNIILAPVVQPVFQTSTPGTYIFLLQIFDGISYSELDQVVIQVAKPRWTVDPDLPENHERVHTLAAAMDSSQAGDTIYVVPGIHQANSDIVVKEDVFLFGLDAESTIIEFGCYSGGPGNVLYIYQADRVSMQGLTIRHARGTDIGSDIRVGGIVIHESNNVEIRDVISINNCGDGIRLIDANDVLISRNLLRSNATNGIRSGSSSFTLVDSRVDSNGVPDPPYYAGVTIEDDPKNVTLLRDTLEGNENGQIKLANTSTIEINESRFAGVGAGIWTLQGANPTVSIDNSIFSGNTGTNIFCWDGGEFDISSSQFIKTPAVDTNKAVDFISCQGILNGNSVRGYTSGFVLSASQVDVTNNDFNEGSLGIRVVDGNPPCPTVSGNTFQQINTPYDYSGTTCGEPVNP